LEEDEAATKAMLAQLRSALVDASKSHEEAMERLRADMETLRGAAV
jgi:hypothetical protein